MTDELPTIAYSSNQSPESSTETRQNIGLQQGTKPRFDDETKELLRRRLFGAAVAVGSILGIAFVGNLILGNTELWWLRSLFLLAMFTALYLLRSQDQAKTAFRSMALLRGLEMMVFGVFYLQLVMMMVTRLCSYAAVNDVGSVAAVRFGYLAAFCVLILAYGIFVPNNWKRGSLVIIPMAIIPYFVLHFVAQFNEPVMRSFLAIEYKSPIPLTMMAAAVGIFGVQTINTARRQAFRARQFGQYRLGKLLGRGGMGEVYQAEHLLLKRPCAIKLIRPESEADSVAIGNFEREVKATAKLSHWNTVEIFDYGRTDDGAFYYVMEFLRGLSLADLVIHHGPIGPSRTIYLMRQLCNALDEAHAMGLIHRDLKPANIFVSQLGRQQDIAKLLDFGLVKERVRDKAEPQSGGSFSGTPQFMSPEQAIAYNAVDGRSDIYSLGCVAYYALTGEPPFARPSVLETLKAHAKDDVVPPSTLNSSVPVELDAIILKCLEKEPKDRYQTVDDLAIAFDECVAVKPWTNADAVHWWDSTEFEEMNPTVDTMKDVADLTRTMVISDQESGLTQDPDQTRLL